MCTFTLKELNVLTEKYSDSQKSNNQSIQSNEIEETSKISSSFSEHQIKLLGAYQFYLRKIFYLFLLKIEN